MLNYFWQNKNLIIIVIIIFLSFSNYILNNGFGSGDDISLLIHIGNSDISFVDSFIKSFFNPTNISRPISAFLRVLTLYILHHAILIYEQILIYEMVEDKCFVLENKQNTNY